MNEELEKAKYANAAMNMTSQQCGAAIGGQIGIASRPSLRESIQSQLYRAESEGAKASRLHELNYLLEKNPEVARILDLMEDVRR